MPPTLEKENAMTIQQSVLSIGDMIDKLSILIRKIFFGEESAYEEYCVLIAALDELGYDGEMITACIRVGMMNTEIWNLENMMRRDPRQIEELSVEELADYGRRAIKIRDLNRKRIQAKNSINDLTGGCREVKVNHAST